MTLPLPEKKQWKMIGKRGKKWFTSYPVPELEHIGLVDAELLHLRRVCGQRGKVLGHVRFLQINSKRLNQCGGSGMFIPDPGSDFFRSRIPDSNCLHPGSRILVKEFKYFNPKKSKKMVSKL